MLLTDLINSAGLRDHRVHHAELATAVEIGDIAHDTRRLAPRSLFCCVRGAHYDGHRFAADAVRGGAVALMCDAPVAVDVPQVVVPDVRSAMGPLAAAFFGHPSRTLQLFGVTGTNGKTTIAHVLAEVARALGLRASSIGTLSGARTTPEAPDLQRRLAVERDHHTRVVAMEVSSHALAQHRVDGTRFTAVAFTNLTPDHLDFHGTMERYYQAKRRLFGPSFTDTAVIDKEGSYADRLTHEIEIANVVQSGVGTVELLRVTLDHSEFVWRGHTVRFPLGGRFNVSNAAVAADLLWAVGFPAPDIARALSSVSPVPGRFEPVEAGQPFDVIVDYAHTPDGLARVLEAARAAASGRVIVVFGCGGDRDVAKRPLMGAEAERGADIVIVTSDNPRSEAPQAIIEMVMTGIRRGAIVEPDRRSAIAEALSQAAAGDVVVIAGKGHETTQIIGDQSYPFDDRVVARELLEERVR